MEAAFRHLLAAMVLSAGAVFCSFLGPPCTSPLGLQLDVNDYSLTFDVAVSSGDANNIRVNGPKSWRPENVSGSFLEINISQPVLLTGLQVQGDPQETGQIISWLLDTSQDCETYQTESCSLDPTSPVHTQTVYLKSMQFVSCIRLRPTHFKGKSPELRLELLGCVIEDNSVCDRDVHPVTELWLESGGRQLNFLHEIVISWVKILLDLQVHGDTGDAGIFYSRSCDQWQYYEPSDTRVIAVTSPDQTSSWMTIDMDKPVRAKCLRIFPPFSTNLKEVHTSGCSAHVTTSLHEIRRNNNTNLDDTALAVNQFTMSISADIAGYQEDVPNVSSNQIMEGDEEPAKQISVLHQEKEKSLLSETSITIVKSSQKQHDVGKATPTSKIVTEDSDLQVTRSSEETSASSTATIQEATEDAITPLHIAKEIRTIEDILPEDLNLTTALYKDGLTESTQTPVDINLTTALYNTEITRDNKETLTQSTRVNNNVTSLTSLSDQMVTQKTHVINETMANNMTDVGVATDDQQSTAQVSVGNNTEDNSSGRTLETTVDTSPDSSTMVQDIASSSSIPSLDNGIMAVHQSVNDSASIHSEDSISVVPSEDSSSVSHLEGNDSTTESEKNTSDTNAWWRSNCGVKSGVKGYRKKRVISGQRNVPGEWPWLVSMHFLPPNEFTNKSGFKHLCGASLIAPGWILTAAHCFSDEVQPDLILSNIPDWRIFVGLHDLTRGDNQDFVQERLIEKFFSYPEYNLTNEPLIYDIALVKLNETVDYSDTVSPVCLDDTDKHYEEIPCYVSGWGQLSNDSPGSRFPHTASVTTLSPDMCKDKYDSLPENHPMKQYIRMEPPVLCGRVGTSGEDACQGDSGGPLMCQHDGRWYQAGVVAAGYLCGQEVTPGLYSRVAYYFDWIRQIIADNGGP